MPKCSLSLSGVDLDRLFGPQLLLLRSVLKYVWQTTIVSIGLSISPQIKRPSSQIGKFLSLWLMVWKRKLAQTHLRYMIVSRLCSVQPLLWISINQPSVCNGISKTSLKLQTQDVNTC